MCVCVCACVGEGFGTDVFLLFPVVQHYISSLLVFCSNCFEREKRFIASLSSPQSHSASARSRSTCKIIFWIILRFSISLLYTFYLLLRRYNAMHIFLCLCCFLQQPLYLYIIVSSSHLTVFLSPCIFTLLYFQCIFISPPVPFSALICSKMSFPVPHDPLPTHLISSFLNLSPIVVLSWNWKTKDEKQWKGGFFCKTWWSWVPPQSQVFPAPYSPWHQQQFYWDPLFSYVGWFFGVYRHLALTQIPTNHWHPKCEI